MHAHLRMLQKYFMIQRMCSRVMAKNIFNKKVSSIVIMEDTNLSTSLFEFFSYFIMVISGNQ